MAKVSLRIYNREIEKLIEQSRLDEAIAHCRHILTAFSKHLETYRLLGKSYLEAKRYAEAVDIFQRILTSVPDDFVSHVGMSIINDDQNKLDDAIWHMERAFEVQPSNAAIHGELQRLFGRRDGVEPPKIRLTRGALAHMYVQGELYNQAISEINAVLANDAQRTDMQVLLAKAYFRNGQKAEATDICTQLLRRFPYSFDANRVMVELLPGTQRAESTQVYRHRVSELDPYAAFVQESIFRSDEVPDAAVSLERFEYTGQVSDSSSSWGGELGIGLETDATAISSSAQQPDWLKAAATPGPSASIEAAPAAASASQPQEEIPDFLRQAGWGESSGQFQESAASFDSESESSGAVQADLPDWVKAMAPTNDAAAATPTPTAQPAPSEDTPDWLQNLGGDQNPPAPAPETASSADTPAWLKDLGAPVAPATPASSGTFDDVPDWLKGSNEQANVSAPEPPSQPVVQAPKPSSQPVAKTPEPSQTFGNDVPDWLKGLNDDQASAPASQPVASQSAPETPAQKIAPEPAPAGSLGNLGTSSQEQDDAMAWLESLASKHGAKSEELVTDPNARTDVAPDWVDKAKAIGEAPAEQPAASSTDETGMWLRNLEQSESQADVPSNKDIPAPQEESPAWLSELSGVDTYNEIAAAPQEETPITGSEAAPDWLSELGPASSSPAAGAHEEDVPEWLRGGPSQPVQPVEPAEPEPVASQDFSFDTNPSAAGLPDWLSGLDKDENAPQATSRSDLPSWLQSDAEPETTQPANPADWHPADMEVAAPIEEMPPVDQQPVRETDFAFEEPKPVKKPAPKPEKKTAAPRLKQTGILTPRSADTLSNAQAELGRGNISTALGIYDKLIRKGKFLEEIIRDLRDALYRYPVEVSIWQALGDAYMRGNRLQEALDAYTKAEELLR